MPRKADWRRENVEQARANERAYYHRNREACIARSTDYQLRKKYGITTEQRDEMIAAQGGRCAICNTDTPRGKGGWKVDHCHTTKQVRGMLCNECNIGLGKFRDNPKFLAEAIQYLGSHSGS